MSVKKEILKALAQYIEFDYKIDNGENKWIKN
jgi:hypothetical protein